MSASAFAATYYGANGWLLEIAGLRVLVDPWLVGSLMFPPGPWLFQGEMASPLAHTRGAGSALAHPGPARPLPSPHPGAARSATARGGVRPGGPAGA